jgi:hypothetical protein
VKSKSKSKRSRHTFSFKITTPGEPARMINVKAGVTWAKRPVTLLLTAEDVERSIRAKGVGNTQTCSMAVCAKRQASQFPHSVEGFIDWQYSRAYVVSKVSKETGLPSHCVAYVHHDNIAKLNDTKGGQKKLLAALQAEGPRTIKLLPMVANPSGKVHRSSKRDGTRAPRATFLKGAHARYAFAQLGGVA